MEAGSSEFVLSLARAGAVVGSGILFAPRIADRGAPRLARPELLEALGARFDAEGIETNYPVRTVYLRGEDKGTPPPTEGDP